MKGPIKKGVGRPLEEPENKRTEKGIVNLTQKEKEMFLKFVTSHGMSLSQFFRDAGKQYIELEKEKKKRKGPRKPRGSIED